MTLDPRRTDVGVGSCYEDIGQMYSSYDEMPFESCAARSMSVIS